MNERTHRSISQTWSRRRFLRVGGASIAGIAAAPYVATAQRSWFAKGRSDEEILAQAEARIQQHRTASATLKLTGPDGAVLPPGIEVKINQKRHKFLFGCNIFMLARCRTPEQNDAYAERFSGLLNFATLPFYWWNYERQKGKPQDERTDEVVRWCKAHDVTTKGHPLAWNHAEPRWLSGTPEEVMELQFQRIERCMRRFQGDIDIWDVVNEATAFDRDEVKERAPLLTEAIAKMGVGPYVRGAFRKARQANPGATLLINDYRVDPAYANKVISELVDDGKRPLYDVIGIQSHMHGSYWGAARTWGVCERFAKFGKPLHFTETTVVSGPKSDAGWNTTADGEKKQAERVGQFYTVLFSHPAVEAITWWDFSDQSAWQGAPAGLVGKDMSPKPAYEALHSLIKDKWWTRATAATRTEGQVSLRGFLGRYEVSARYQEQAMTGQFSLEPGADGAIEVRLT